MLLITLPMRSPVSTKLIYSASSLLVTRFEFILVVQEPLILIHLRACGHCKQRLLIFGVFLARNIKFDQKLLVFVLQQIEPFYLLLKVLSQGLIGEDKLLDRGVLFARVDVCHLVGVNDTLEHLDLLSESRLVGALGGQGFKTIVGFAKCFILNTLFLDDSLELFDN